MIYCENPECTRKVKKRTDLFVCCGYEKRVCIDCDYGINTGQWVWDRLCKIYEEG